MMIGEVLRRHHPTVQIPNFEPPYEPDPSSPYYTKSSSSHYYNHNNPIQIPTSASHHHHDYSPQSVPLSDYSPSSLAADYAAALHRHHTPSSPSSTSSDHHEPYDSFACDEFRIYDFKVRRCVRGRSHDWTECPFAHPGEKARRRDPRRFHYSGTPCPDFRKGACRKGDACEFAHGVFECWLHPDRYRTQPCKDWIHCSRRVCFFAHTPEQLRVLSDQSAAAIAPPDIERTYFSADQSSLSPPMSPPSTRYGGFDSVSELVGRMNGLQLQMGGTGGALGAPSAVTDPRRWGFQLTRNTGLTAAGSVPGNSLPSTPTRTGRTGSISGRGLFDSWNYMSCVEETVMERVESGRDIRARMYAKLTRDNSLDRPESSSPGPDLGWVSELVK